MLKTARNQKRTRQRITEMNNKGEQALDLCNIKRRMFSGPLNKIATAAPCRRLDSFFSCSKIAHPHDGNKRSEPAATQEERHSSVMYDIRSTARTTTATTAHPPSTEMEKMQKESFKRINKAVGLGAGGGG